jgi:hypothetical protein
MRFVSGLFRTEMVAFMSARTEFVPAYPELVSNRKDTVCLKPGAIDRYGEN